MLDASTISSVLASLFDDQITMTINRSVVLGQLLEALPSAGKNLQWVPRTGTATPTTAPIADGADVSTYNSDTKLPAILGFTTYHDAFSISGRALAAARAANNPAELADLLGEELMESVTRLAAALGTHAYTGTGSSNQILGLVATAGGIKSTGTYATIDRSVYTQWAATEVLNGGVPRALSFTLMRDTRRQIYQASGRKPDLIVCDPIQHEAYGKLFDANQQRRYVQDVYLRGNKITLDGGYQVLEFDGIPVVEDHFCPTGQMLFLNTSEVKWRYLPFAASAPGMGQTEVGLHGTPEEQFGQSPMRLSARIQPLAVTGDAYKFQLLTYPQMQVKNPNTCGILGDLS